MLRRWNAGRLTTAENDALETVWTYGHGALLGDGAASGARRALLTLRAIDVHTVVFHALAG